MVMCKICIARSMDVKPIPTMWYKFWALTWKQKMVPCITNTQNYNNHVKIQNYCVPRYLKIHNTTISSKNVSI